MASKQDGRKRIKEYTNGKKAMKYLNQKQTEFFRIFAGFPNVSLAFMISIESNEFL